MARASLREEDEDRFAEGLPPLTPQMIEAAISPKRGSATPRSPPETPERLAARKAAEEAPGQSAGQSEESRNVEKTADKSEGGSKADDAKAKIASAGSWFSQKMSELGGAAKHNFDSAARRGEDDEADEDGLAAPPSKASASASASPQHRFNPPRVPSVPIGAAVSAAAPKSPRSPGSGGEETPKGLGRGDDTPKGRPPKKERTSKEK